MNSHFDHLKPDTFLQQRLTRWAAYCAVLVLITGLLVLIGWQWDITLLTRPVPHLTAMNPLSALNFILTALSLLFLIPKNPIHTTITFSQRSKTITGKVLAGVVLLTGLIKLAGDMQLIQFQIDHILFPHQLVFDTTGDLSGQMTINTASCFILTGASLLLLNTKTTTGRIPAHYLAVVIGMLGLFSVIGYLYRVHAFYVAFRYVPMAIHTAFCFLLISLSLLFANPDHGFMQEFTSADTGGATARRMLPLVIFLPVLLGYLRLWGNWLGLFSTEFGVTILVLSIMFIIVLLIGYNTRLLNKRDALKNASEMTLLESEQRYRLLVSSVKDYAIYMLDPSGHVMSWNDGAERIKGYKADEIIGKHLSVFYTREEISRNEPAHNLARAKDQGRFEKEGWRLRKDGTPFWANIVFAPIYDTTGQLMGFAKVTRDITEKKQAEEQIAYMARLMEDSSDAIFSTDASFNIRTWNKAAELLFGYTLAEVKGRPASEILRSPISEEARRPLQKKLIQDGYWKGEAHYLKKDDTDLTIFTSISGVKNVTGKLDGFVMVCRDFTERKKLELQLKEFNKDLERQVTKKTAELTKSYEDIRELASHLQNVREEERAGIAREVHDELGQQLTGIKMDLSWIAKSLPVKEEDEVRQKLIGTLELLDTTIKTVRRIATELRPSILDDLGLIAAIEWQSMEFQKRSGIPTRFTSDLAEFNAPSSIGIGLFRICQESLTNIARYAEARTVSVSLREMDDKLLLLEVKDDGKGFQPDQIGHKKTLGLLGMKERTLMMGGDFSISSKPGKGTTLSVTVPFNITET